MLLAFSLHVWGKLHEFQGKAEGLQSAMDELCMEMGEDIARYLEVTDDQQKEVAASKQQLAGCQTPVCNTGKKIDFC